MALDILSIDAEIRKRLEQEVSRLPQLRERLRELETTLESKNLKERLRDPLLESHKQIQEQVQDLEDNSRYNFYVSETSELLKRYREKLRTPVKLSFVKKVVHKDEEKEKIVQDYLRIASEYTNMCLRAPQVPKTPKCKRCGNEKDFDIADDDVFVCTNCSAEQKDMGRTSSYNDIDRVNVSSKYEYERKVHFRDCMKQYQGKQNCSIQPEVYTGLEEEFRQHHLLVDSKDKYTRFSRITKAHILMFLKELGFTKHYGNVHLIHYTLTGKKPDDIGHLEDVLLRDFDTLSELYDKEYGHIDRKNFINTQYVLCQLLYRHRHRCNEEDFTILKTIERKAFHDEVGQTLFQKLGWNHRPYY